MPDRTPDPTPVATKNLDGYGNPPLDWDLALKGLGNWESIEHPWFLGTVRPDGTPHSVGIGPQWRDGRMFFTSSPAAQKSHNLEANPSCTLSTRQPKIDLTLNGRAQRVTDPATVAAAAKAYNDHGWPAEAAGDAITAPFSAPSAGPPPWNLYEFFIESVVGVATTEPGGATKWSLV